MWKTWPGTMPRSCATPWCKETKVLAVKARRSSRITLNKLSMMAVKTMWFFLCTLNLPLDSWDVCYLASWNDKIKVSMQVFRGLSKDSDLSLLRFNSKNIYFSLYAIFVLPAKIYFLVLWHCSNEIYLFYFTFWVTTHELDSCLSNLSIRSMLQ